MVGRYSSVLEDTGRNAKTTGFTSELGGPRTVPVVTEAVAYICKYTGKTLILVIYNVIYFRKMATNLAPPIMIRIAFLCVDECPKLFSSKPTEINYSVYFLMSYIRIPFQQEGMI